MKLRIAHSSDLHGNIDVVIQYYHNKNINFDLWLDTGDFFPNSPECNNTGIVNHSFEKEFQEQWLNENNRIEKINNFIKNIPFVSVPGNHDFINLVEMLIKSGNDNVYQVIPEGINVFGIKIAGFPEIPFINGEWNFEVHECNQIIEQAVLSGADILATHAPSKGILDLHYKDNDGWSKLTSSLMYLPHTIRHHFFGHIHESYGKIQQNGIKFYNGSCNFKIHEIEI